MNLGQIFSCILIAFGAASFYMGISASRKKFRAYSGNLILGILCFASSIWSFGFAMVFLTDNVSIAYWGRTVGMIGVFAYLILAQFLVGALGDLPKQMYIIVCVLSLFGALIYVPTILPSQTTFYISEYGMTYVFKSGLINNIYTAYTVVYAVNMLLSIIFLLKRAKTKRSKVNGHRMIVTVAIIFTGMILDTVLPTFGFGAVPGSSLTQFLGTLVIYYAIVDYNQTRITPMNMSRYVYSFVNEPIMVFDLMGKLNIVNDAGKRTFKETLDICKPDETYVSNVFKLPMDYFGFEGDNRTDSTTSVIGDIPVEIQTNRIRDKYGDTVGYIMTIKDMTQIRSMMNSLVEEKQRADANNLAKSFFLANMSHEIRTPLNAIVGFSEILLKSDLSAADRDATEDICNSAYNLLAIINDILDISKIESGRMELNEQEYALKDVIKDAYLITQTLASKKSLQLSMDIAEDLPSRVLGDATRVRGILVNILNNAVKYTRQGSVKLVGRVERLSTKDALFTFQVIDTGIGIRKEDMDVLFESFKQVDLKSNTGIEGTGLGLAIVKGFLNLMDGDISVESEYGVGSTFTMKFHQQIVDDTPIGKITAGPSGEKKSAISDIKFPGVRVLAVDDNRVNLKVVSRTLQRYEMDVTTADSGMESLELCKSNAYDIILMDHMMPGMDGVEAMQKIREFGGIYAAGGACKIVALTANAISGVREEMIAAGFDDYLSKPIEFPKMEALFASYVKG